METYTDIYLHVKWVLANNNKINVKNEKQKTIRKSLNFVQYE